MQTTIRVKFSDRTQLEKTFPSTNKIRSVYAFVRSSLREDVRPIKFILCKYFSSSACRLTFGAILRPITAQTRSKGLRSDCTRAHVGRTTTRPVFDTLAQI
jgi:hypothetical protein